MRMQRLIHRPCGLRLLHPQAFLVDDAGIQSAGDEPAEEIHRKGGGDVAGKNVVNEQAELDADHPQADAENGRAAQTEHAAMEGMQRESGNDQQQAERQPADFKQQV